MIKILKLIIKNNQNLSIILIKQVLLLERNDMIY